MQEEAEPGPILGLVVLEVQELEGMVLFIRAMLQMGPLILVVAAEVEVGGILALVAPAS